MTRTIRSLLLCLLALVLGGVTAGATEPRIKITYVSVKGAIDGENITFTVDFTVDARVRRPEIALATGDLVLDPAGDHRMAMAFAVLSRLHALDLDIEDRACVGKSWPGFWEFMRRFR